MNRVVLMSAGAALALSLPACDRAEAPAPAPAPGEANAASAADTDAVDKLHADALAALNGKNWAAVKALYAPDAVMIIPDAPAFNGAQAINGEYDRLAADPAMKFEGTAGATHVSSGGDLAYGDGTYKVAYTNPETKKVESGNGYYVFVFKKQSDGSWKIVRDVSAPLPAAPAAG